jgi:predicted dehydrogenase
MIEMAVVGFGHWGPNLVRNFHTSGRSRVRYAIDRDSKRLGLLRSRYSDIETLADFDRALNDPAIDAVAIATPTTTHFSLCRRALEAGKHVLVEKPLAASTRDAEELVGLAREKKRILLVGHVFLYNAAVQHVKKLLGQGELGRIYYLSMLRTNLGPIRIDVNAAWDLASHDASIADYWLGASPVSVSAVGKDYINSGIADVVFATLRYPNGVLVNLHASWLNPRKARDVTVVGDRRMLTFDDMNPNEPIKIYDKGVSDETVPGIVDTFSAFRASVREGEVVTPKIPHSEPLKAECDHFLDCVANGTTPLTDGRTGLAVVRTLEAIQRSLESGGGEEKVS